MGKEITVATDAGATSPSAHREASQMEEIFDLPGMLAVVVQPLTGQTDTIPIPQGPATTQEGGTISLYMHVGVA